MRLNPRLFLPSSSLVCSRVSRSYTAMSWLLAGRRMQCLTAVFSPFGKFGRRAIGNSVFVSKFRGIPLSEITDVLRRQNLEYTDTGENLVIKVCPFCHDTKNDATNEYKLNILKSNGTFHCFRCESSGSWFKFLQMTGRFDISGLAIEHEETVVEFDPHQLNKKPLTSKKAVETMKFLEKRKIKLETAQAFGVYSAMYSFFDNDKKAEAHECVVFPWFDASCNEVRAKVRSITDKKYMRLIPKGGAFGFFGWNLVADTDKEIIITEGEIDAMSVYQETKRKAISLPNGAKSLPPQLLPMLERFEKIYLWLDDDIPGREGVQMCVSKLGVGRCLIVKTKGGTSTVGPKDANDAHIAGKDLNAILNSAHHINDDLLLSLRSLRSDVLNIIANPNQQRGDPFPGFPRLTKILKGHRRGELSIFTGRTGMGKTTLLAQLSLNLATQNVATLWGSFEIPNPILVAKLFKQFRLKDSKHYEKNPDELSRVFDKFEELPIYCLNRWATTDISTVIDAMDIALYKYDVRHIIIDNLQFMTYTPGADRFEKQDDAISKLRYFASKKDVHISLVVHPRKEDEDKLLSPSSVFGSAKATQEADNIVILQSDGLNNRFLDIRKNRFDGELGRVYFQFDRDSCRFTEVDAHEQFE